MTGLIIQQALQEANKTFFLPRSIRLDLLKNCPQAIPTLVQWSYNEWHSYDASLTKERLFHSYNNRLNEDRIPITFVVLKENAPIGTISLKEELDPVFSDFPPGSLWIGSLQIFPEERQQGLGQALLQFVATVAGRLGRPKLYFYTSNPLNVAWYIKRGAHVVERRSFHNHTITVMHINLYSTQKLSTYSLSTQIEG